MADTTIQAQVQAAMSVVTQLSVTAMTVNVFASALGILLAATGFEAIPEIPATRKGIRSLRESFGDYIVVKAVKSVGKENIVLLAVEVDRLVRENMVAAYGEWATEKALSEAPSGDLRTAGEIASALSRRRITPISPPEKVEEAVSVGKGKARAKAKPVLDKKTGITYKSEYAAGKALATEFEFDPADRFVWFKILKADPGRFKRV